MLPKLLSDHREELKSYIQGFLVKKIVELKSVNDWSTDVIDRLIVFTTSGKLVRGSLVLGTAQVFGQKHVKNFLPLAAAIELTHSGLLIHDDIIDKDEKRRGKPSLHTQYQQYALTHSIKDAQHFGTSFGICVADLLFFMICELLQQGDIPQKLRRELITTFAQELQTVGLAQMQDIYFSLATYSPSETEILQLYRQKTGRYTFALPLMLGGMLAGQPRQVLQLLEASGESLGLIFQIKDDELGLFGDSSTTGKPVGTDVIRGNKTLYHLYLYQAATIVEKRRLSQIFGNPKADLRDISCVRKLVRDYGIDKKIAQQIVSLEQKTRSVINKLPQTIDKQPLFDLLTFSKTRTV